MINSHFPSLKAVIEKLYVKLYQNCYSECLCKLTNGLPPVKPMRKLITLFTWKGSAASQFAIIMASELLLTEVACVVPWHKETP